MNAEGIAKALGGAARSGKGWLARCPAHNDRKPSLSVDDSSGRLLVNCFAGCSQHNIVSALRSKGLWPSSPPPNLARHGAIRGCSLEDYAEAKRLPIEFLRNELGLEETSLKGLSAIAIPYLDANHEILAVRYRTAMEGPDRFRWRKGDRPTLYGLDRIARHTPAKNSIFLVEGESDCHTLWLHETDAVGIPGAGLWDENAHGKLLSAFDVIYVVLEPDDGGRTLERHLARSALAPKIHVVDLGQFKDVSEFYIDDPGTFPARWANRLDKAKSLVEEFLRVDKRRFDIRRRAICPELSQSGNILAELARDFDLLGAVGVSDFAQTLYLVVTSRLFDRPLSVVVKGPSSGGKSYLVESVLKFFPAEAFYTLTALSEKALIYLREPLSHRMLVIYEAAGMSGDIATYLIRSLLSEGHIRYATVQAVPPDGVLQTVFIEKEGPTGLIATTTAVSLHPENETRMLSLTVTDTPEQTRAILAAQAVTRVRGPVDFSRWHSLHEWLALGPTDVVIPFAEALANEIPPASVRLRRDFTAVLSLIKAHALLHQESRSRANGSVVADMSDYKAVYLLIGKYVQEGIEASVPKQLRELVEAVEELSSIGHGVSLPPVAKILKLDKSSAARRARSAIARGYIKNQEERKGQPASYVLAEPLPDDVAVLPSPDRLKKAWQHGM